MIPPKRAVSGAAKASLVYHAGALGDFITTLPALRVWRRLHASDHITLIGKPRHAAVAGRFAAWDEVWDVESRSLARLFRAGQDPATDPGGLSRFSSALLFSPLSSPLRRNLEALGVRGIQWQAPFPSSPMPIIDYHLALFPDVEIAEDERIPLVDPGDPREQPQTTASETPGPTVALHPGSGSHAKNWAFARFQALAGELQRRGERIAWIVGPAEEGLALEVPGTVWRDLPLANLCAKLSTCRLYVGNDSGVTHLAAAVGAPTLALFGPSDPRIWAPKGRQVRILKAQKLRDISVSEVVEVCCLL